MARFSQHEVLDGNFRGQPCGATLLKVQGHPLTLYNLL